MKSFVVGWILLFSGVAGWAQSDTIEDLSVQPMADFLYRELFNFSPNSTFGALSIAPPALPQKLMPQPLSFGLLSSFQTPDKRVDMFDLPVFNPFMKSWSLNSFAEYQLTDKLILGGNSFSGQSIFSPATFPGSSNHSMDFRGASMFLEYKVSKNVRISGGFHVTNQHQPY